MELKIGHINEINVWLIPLMAICCMGSCRFSSGIFYFINIYSSLSKDRYLCCLWSQWICITLSEHLHGAHSIHKAELKFLHLKPWHHKEIWFRVKIWFRVQILLEKNPRLFRTGASFQIDQNWEHLHFAGEIPASQRCFFSPSSSPCTFPTPGPHRWAESIRGDTKISLFHLPGRGGCAPVPHPSQKMAVLKAEMHSSPRKHITVQITFEFRKFRI